MSQLWKKVSKSFSYGEKGFTLIELLIVIAILGVLAAVAIPNLSKFIGSGKTQAKAAELAALQTAVSAMLSDSTTGVLDAGFPANAGAATSSLAAVKSTKTAAGDLLVTSYISAGSLSGNSLKSGYLYYYDSDGTVHQT